MREAERVAKRDGLVSPWIVEVAVYNDAGPPAFLATVSGGTLVHWGERNIEEPVIGPDEPLSLDFEAMSVCVGFTHQEFEEGLADGSWVLLLDHGDSEQGRVRIGATTVGSTVVIARWHDPNGDGNWVWLETSNLPRACASRLNRWLDPSLPKPD